MRSVLAVLLLAGSVLTGAEAGYKVGVAAVPITPPTPIWLSGYAARVRPAETVLHELWAKAVAIEDRKGNQVVIVTTDLIGLPRTITDFVSAEVARQYKLERGSLLFNSSHTHTGPVVRGNLAVMYDLDAGQARRIEEYGKELTAKLITVIGAALGDKKPAEIAFGRGKAGFAVNRREFTPQGVRIGVNPNGPVDHTVPVIRIRGQGGELRAVIFGYACHNTTLTGEHYVVSGDYAGFAQLALEKEHRGAKALFLTLCAGDQNPHPRGEVPLAQRHGEELAKEVSRVLATEMKPLRGALRSAFQITRLNFRPHTRADFEALLKDENKFKVRNAREQLKAYDAGTPITRVAYPVQAIRFDRELTLVALGGEVVIDYNLRIQREYDDRREPVVVAGYSNDVMCYVPSLRVLREGGYEAVDSMIFYGQPGPFTEEVEETVMTAVEGVMRRVGRKPAAGKP